MFKKKSELKRDFHITARPVVYYMRLIVSDCVSDITKMWPWHMKN